MAKTNEEDVHRNGDSSSDVSFKLNVHAPEFLPRSQSLPPFAGYYYHHPCFHLLGGGASPGGGSDWFYVAQQPPLPFIANSNVLLGNCDKNFLHDDLCHRIVKQVEYLFSDMSLISSDTLSKYINKDPEGYVPISAIASSKKIKSLVNSPNLLTQALRTSSKLVLSHDGKKVRRKHLFTDRDKEDLQSRVVVADNLPEDHSHPNIEKIFGVVGSIKNIRICHPQESNASRSKGDIVVSNKLHALVEYQTVEQAEKAVEKLNDERNWRKCLHVRLLLRRSPRSVIRSRKSDYDNFDFDEDDIPPTTDSLENSHHHQPNKIAESSNEANMPDRVVNTEDTSSYGLKKGGWSRGRVKSRGRGQNHNCHGAAITLLPQSSGCFSIQCEASIKQTPLLRGPRMPDGTRGFTMGRGKPLSV